MRGRGESDPIGTLAARAALVLALVVLVTLVGACGADSSSGGGRGDVAGAGGGAGSAGMAGTSATGGVGVGTGGMGPSVPGADADTDGDHISDYYETKTRDSDEDGTPDFQDDDSDNDGIPDADEAGDADLKSLPVDTDGDGDPDFRDLDSDDDGLPDADELARKTDPLDADSDGDKVSDLTEVAAGTDPNDKKSNPAQEGNFFFRIPYKEKPEPPKGTLVFKPEIKVADVYFLMDSSVSMGPAIDGVRTSLTGTIVPGITAAIPDLQVGAGEFDTCPEKLNSAGDVGIHHLAGTTDDAMAVATAIATVTANGGPSEPYLQSMWLFATGDTTLWPTTPPATPACGAGRIGYGCVRSGALPILVMIGDEPITQSDNCTVKVTTAMVSDALNAIGAKLVVMGPTSTAGGNVSWTEIAQATGSVDAMGNPYFFASANLSELSGGAAGPEVVNAITKLADEIALDLTTKARDLDNDGVDATDFIARIDANKKGGVADPRDSSIVCVGGLMTSDRDGDGHDETFDAVRSGTPVCFDIIAKQNTSVKSKREPQVFKAAVDVVELKSGSVLDTREVFFLVPPKPPTIGEPSIF